MIQLTRSLQEDLSTSAMMHSCLCPRQVIGVRMARLACSRLGIDPALEREQIFVYMEMGRCAADAVIAVTGASPTNHLMKLMDYGKVAATFVSLQTHQAIRISERQNCREIALKLMSASGASPEMSSWEAQRNAYQIMPDEQLLQWQDVSLVEPIPAISDNYVVRCDNCGDQISDHSEVILDGETMCKSCAYGAYYQSLDFPFSLRNVTPPHNGC